MRKLLKNGTNILLLVFPPLLLALFAAPESRYGILSQIGMLQSASENLFLSVLSLSTLFEILLFCLLFILGLLLLLVDRSYNRHFLAILNGILVSFLFLLAILSLSCLFLSGMGKAGNIVSFVFSFLFLALYWIAFFFQEKEYHVLVEESQKEEEREEDERLKKKAEIRSKLNDLYKRGSLPKEEYEDLVDKLEGRKKDENE